MCSLIHDFYKKNNYGILPSAFDPVGCGARGGGGGGGVREIVLPADNKFTTLKMVSSKFEHNFT